MSPVIFKSCQTMRHHECCIWKAGSVNGVWRAAATQCACPCHVRPDQYSCGCVGHFHATAAERDRCPLRAASFKH